jgi:hypothetical protein
MADSSNPEQRVVPPLAPAETTAPAAPAAVPPVQQTSTLAAELDKQNLFGIGFQVGLATGTGVSLRYSMKNRFVLEVSGGYIAVNGPVWSFGGELQFLLNNTDISRLYALVGVSTNYVSSADTNKLDAPSRVGIGVGYEHFISNRLSLAAELPITIFIETDPLVLPLPQFQLIYYFD